MKARRLNIVLSISILVLTSIFLAHCAKEDSPTEPTDTIDLIGSVIAEPDSIVPGSTSTLTVLDGEVGPEDTLTYTWSTFEGYFGTTPTTKSLSTPSEFVVWTSPNRIGSATIYVEATNGSITSEDSVTIYLNNPIATTIITPQSDSYYMPEDTVTFTASILGLESITYDSSYFRWRIADSTLHETVNAANLSFASALGYGERQVILDATVFTSNVIDTSVSDTVITEILQLDTLMSSDTVMVNNSLVEALVLYDIEKSYKYNRLTWSKFIDASGEYFAGYVVSRTPGLYGTSISYDTLSALDGYTTNDTSGYLDTLIVIGETVRYTVSGLNTFGRSTPSNVKSIASGIFSQFNGPLGDLVLDNQRNYAYASQTDVDSVVVLDITSNSIDFRFGTDSGPLGLAFNGDDLLYVANSGDTTITEINVDDMTVSSEIGVTITSTNERRNPMYMAYREFPSFALIVTVSGNNYPVIIEETFSGIEKYEFERSGLIHDSSFVMVDETRGLLYISEYDGYPMSLFKYTMVGTADTWSVMEDLGHLGYRLKDMAFTPDGERLLLACESPYKIQIVPTTNGFYPETSSIETGPYPNAVTISADGSLAYTASSNNEINIWDISDIQNPTFVKNYRFASPVIRDGIEITDDDRFLVVITYNQENDISQINLVESP